jgi:hypothetical protein
VTGRLRREGHTQHGRPNATSRGRPGYIAVHSGRGGDTRQQPNPPTALTPAHTHLLLIGMGSSHCLTQHLHHRHGA